MQKPTNVQTSTFVQTFRPQMCKQPYLCKHFAHKCTNNHICANISSTNVQMGEIVERCTIGYFQTLSTLNRCRIAPYAWIFRFLGIILKNIDGAFRIFFCILSLNFLSTRGLNIKNSENLHFLKKIMIIRTDNSYL